MQRIAWLLIAVVLVISGAAYGSPWVYTAPQGTYPGFLGGGFVIGLALQGMDLTTIDFSKIKIDPTTCTLTAQFPAGVKVNRHQLRQDMRIVIQFTQTFTDWRTNPNTVVRLDEDGHLVNAAGEAIINDKGDTATPKGKVTSITFKDFERQLQVVENCQQALMGATMGWEKKQYADDLAKAVTLLQNMDNAFRISPLDSAQPRSAPTPLSSTPSRSNLSWIMLFVFAAIAGYALLGE